MSRFTSALRPSLSAAAFGLFALLAPAALRAQTTTPPKVFTACYVPSSGSVYRIQEADLKQECVKSTHVQFSWTDGNPAAVSQTFTVASDTMLVTGFRADTKVKNCPAGTQLVGGGYTLTKFDLFLSPLPLIQYNGPNAAGTGWQVTLYNGTNPSMAFMVWARCAK